MMCCRYYSYVMRGNSHSFFSKHRGRFWCLDYLGPPGDADLPAIKRQKKQLLIGAYKCHNRNQMQVPHPILAVTKCRCHTPF